MSRAGMRVGPYTIEAKLGEGGMGSVFAARSEQGERVALKLLRHDAFLDAEVLARFGREARVLGELNHPNIVALRGMGSVPGVGEYLALEIVDGGSYADRLKRVGPLDPAEAVDVLLGLCSAVGAAHAHGILHRDLKPANVLRRGERPVLTDFGLARRQVASQQLTQTGEVLGTPAYMAPEQTGALEGGTTPATDIYGLGALLYALLTGRPPIQGKSLMDVLVRVGTDVPARPSLARGEPLPASLDALCLRCLAKQPRDRFASVEELADALEEVRAALVVAATPPGDPLPSVATRVALALFALAAAAVVIAVFVFKPPPPRAAASPPSPSAAPVADSTAPPDAALAKVPGLTWDAETHGAPSEEVRRAFRRLSEVPPERLTLEEFGAELSLLPLTTARERLARIDLWAQLLRHVSPPGAAKPSPPEPDWLQAAVRALRWSHAEVSAHPSAQPEPGQPEPAKPERPLRAIARALRGTLWLLYGSRAREDWRRRDQAWRADLEDAFADLDAALRRSLPSRALRKRTAQSFAECARLLRASGVAGARVKTGDVLQVSQSLRRQNRVREVADALCAEFPEAAFPHLLRASFDKPEARRARLEQASTRVEPAERGWLALSLGDVPGLKAAGENEDASAEVRLRALEFLAEREAKDPLEALAVALAILKSAPPSPRHAKRELLALAAEHLRDGGERTRAAALLDTSPLSRADRVSPQALAEWLKLRASCAAPTQKAHFLQRALLEVDEEATRATWILTLPLARRADLRSALRALILRTGRPLPEPLAAQSRRAGLERELAALAQQYARIKARLPRPGSPTQNEDLTRLLPSLSADLDPALRATVLSTISPALLSPSSGHDPGRVIDGALAAFQAWIQSAEGVELLAAHSTRVRWTGKVLPLLRPQQRLLLARPHFESAAFVIEHGPRDERATVARLRARALDQAVLDLPREAPAGNELLSLARRAAEVELTVAGPRAATFSSLARLALRLNDKAGARATAERGLALCPPRLEVELEFLRFLAPLDLTEQGPLEACRRFEARCSPPGQALAKGERTDLLAEQATTLAHLLTLADQPAKALATLGTITRPTAAGALSRFLRTRAFVYRRLGRGLEAAADLSAALGLAPNERLMIHLELSDAYAIAKDVVRARYHWLGAQHLMSAPARLLAVQVTLEAGEPELSARLLDSLSGLSLSPAETQHSLRLRALLRGAAAKTRDPIKTTLLWPAEFGPPGSPPSKLARAAKRRLEAAGPYLTPGIVSEALAPLFEGGEPSDRRAGLALGLTLFDQLSLRASLIHQRVSVPWVQGMVRLLHEANLAVRERPTPALRALRGRLWLLFGVCRDVDWRLLPSATQGDGLAALADLRAALRAPLPETREARDAADALHGASRRKAWKALHGALLWRRVSGTDDDLLERLLKEHPTWQLGYQWAAAGAGAQKRRELLERGRAQVRLPAERAELELRLGGAAEWRKVADDASLPAELRMEACLSLVRSGVEVQHAWKLAPGIAESASDPTRVHGWRLALGEHVALALALQGEAEEAEQLATELLATAAAPQRRANLWKAIAAARADRGEPARPATEQSLAHHWSPDSHLLRGRLLLSERLPEEARAHARVALRLVPRGQEGVQRYQDNARGLGVEPGPLLALGAQLEQIAQADPAGLLEWEAKSLASTDPLIRFELMRALRRRAQALSAPQHLERFAPAEEEFGWAWRDSAHGAERTLADLSLAHSLADLASLATPQLQTALIMRAAELVESASRQLPSSRGSELARLRAGCALGRAHLSGLPEHKELAAQAARGDAASSGETDPEPWFGLASLYRADSELTARDRLLARAEALCPPRWPIAGELALQRTNAAFATWDPVGVVRHCARGLSASGHSPRVLPELTIKLAESSALALSRLKRHDEAARMHARARGLAPSPERRVSWDGIASLLAIRRGEPKRAVEILEQLERDLPEVVGDRAVFLANLAHALDLAGERDKASERWRRLDALFAEAAPRLDLVNALAEAWAFGAARAVIARLSKAKLLLDSAQRARRDRYVELLDSVGGE